MRPYVQKTTDYEEPPDKEQPQASVASGKSLDDAATRNTLTGHPEGDAAQKIESSPGGRTPEPLQLRRKRAFCSNCGAIIYEWCSHCRRGACCQPGCSRCLPSTAETKPAAQDPAIDPAMSPDQHPTDSSERTPSAAMPPSTEDMTPDDGYTTAGTNPIDYPSTDSRRGFPISGRVRKDCDTPQRSLCFEVKQGPVPNADLCNGCCGDQEQVGPLIQCRLCQERWCDVCFDNDTKHWLRCKPEIEGRHRAKGDLAQSSVGNAYESKVSDARPNDGKGTASEVMHANEPIAVLAEDTQQTVDHGPARVESLQVVSENSATARFLEGGGAQQSITDTVPTTPPVSTDEEDPHRNRIQAFRIILTDPFQQIWLREEQDWRGNRITLPGGRIDKEDTVIEGVHRILNAEVCPYTSPLETLIEKAVTDFPKGHSSLTEAAPTPNENQHTAIWAVELPRRIDFQNNPRSNSQKCGWMHVHSAAQLLSNDEPSYDPTLKVAYQQRTRGGRTTRRASQPPPMESPAQSWLAVQLACRGHLDIAEEEAKRQFQMQPQDTGVMYHSASEKGEPENEEVEKWLRDIIARMRRRRQLKDDYQIARQTLIKQGLAVECDLINEHGGKGLSYAATHRAPLPRGKILGVYPRHAGLRTKRYHASLPREAGLRGEYAMEVHNRVLYASPMRLSVAIINESSDPNVLFVPADVQLEGEGDHFFTILCLSIREIQPGEALSTHYGPEFEEIRKVRGYKVCGFDEDRTIEREMKQWDFDQLIREAFTEEELPIICQIAGVLDHEGAPGSRKDPNYYYGGPEAPPNQKVIRPHHKLEKPCEACLRNDRMTMCMYEPARCGAFECSWCRKNQPCSCEAEEEASEGSDQQEATLDTSGCTNCNLGCQVSCFHCKAQWCIPCFYGLAHREACLYDKNSTADRKDLIQETEERCSACQGTPEMVGTMRTCDGCSKQWCTQCEEDYTRHQLSCSDPSEVHEVSYPQQELEDSSSDSDDMPALANDDSDESDECPGGACCAGLPPCPRPTPYQESAIRQCFRSGSQPCFADREIPLRKPGLSEQGKTEQRSIGNHPALPKDVTHPTLSLAIIDTNGEGARILMRKVTPSPSDLATKPMEYELPLTQLDEGETYQQALERLLQKDLNTKAMRRAVRRSTLKLGEPENTFLQPGTNDQPDDRAYHARRGIYTVPVAASYREVQSVENKEGLCFRWIDLKKCMRHLHTSPHGEVKACSLEKCLKEHHPELAEMLRQHEQEQPFRDDGAMHLQIQDPVIENVKSGLKQLPRGPVNPRMDVEADEMLASLEGIANANDVTVDQVRRLAQWRAARRGVQRISPRDIRDAAMEMLGAKEAEEEHHPPLPDDQLKQLEASLAEVKREVDKRVNGGCPRPRVLLMGERTGTAARRWRQAGADVATNDLAETEDNRIPHARVPARIVRDLGFDFIFGCPPCDYLNNASVARLHIEQGRFEALEEAAATFKEWYQAAAPLVVMENSVMNPYASRLLGMRPTEVVKPFDHGHRESKSICLFKVGYLPPLRPTFRVEGRDKRLANMVPGRQRGASRGRSFDGVMAAMAMQWMGQVLNEASKREGKDTRTVEQLLESAPGLYPGVSLTYHSPRQGGGIAGKLTSAAAIQPKETHIRKVDVESKTREAEVRLRADGMLAAIEARATEPHPSDLPDGARIGRIPEGMLPRLRELRSKKGIW